MSLQLIFGPSGSGKSDYLNNHIIEASLAHPEQNFIVLVPEQFTMQTQQDLVNAHPRKGIMNIDVLSFGRLAYRVFEETGKGREPVLDDEGKSLILRKIAARDEEQLTVLKGNMKKLGYISEVKSVISEFTQYDIGQEALSRLIKSQASDARLSGKLSDILLLYRDFEDYLQSHYITKEEQLDVLADVVDESAMLQNSTIALDGFTGFTPVQEKLLQALMRTCRDVWVTVTMDPKEDPTRYEHPYQLFALGKQMSTALLRLAKEAKVPVRDPVMLGKDGPVRFREHPTLAFLEHNLFRQPAEVFSGEPRDLNVFVADNPREEARAVAADIRALVRKRHWRYRDIGIIVTDMEAYGDELSRALSLYEIPFFIDQKRSILLNSFVEYLRSLLDMAQQNFTADSVFRFLRSGLTDFTTEEIDDLENYVIGLGIKGYAGWQQRWIRPLDGMGEADLSRLNHLRVTLVEMTGDLVFVCKQHQKTVRDLTVALYTFLVKEQIQVRLSRQADAFLADGEIALANEYAQVYRIVMDLFDQFVSLLGDEPVGVKEYAQLLDAGLMEARIGVIPPAVDQVVAGDLKRSRLAHVKALFLLGANDVYLPGALSNTGLLSERDRQIFADARLKLSPSGKEKAYQQKYYLYVNLTKPSQELTISYSKVKADGKSIRPSYLIQEIRRLFPDLSVKDRSLDPLRGQEMTPIQGIPKLIEGLRKARTGAGVDAAWAQLYTWYQKDPAWQGKVADLVKAACFSCPVTGLDPDTARQLYGEAFVDSITRMEHFAACPYAHFLTYGLQLTERTVYEFRPVDLGNVCHRALELYGEKLQEEGIAWTAVPREQQAAYVRECLSRSIADYGQSVLTDSARNTQMIGRMERLLTRSVWAMTRQLSEGDFTPDTFEMRFGNGKIDRIDLCEDGDQVYVKVIDYKTGRQTFDVESLYHGLSLQLMVYMDAAMDWVRQTHPGKEVIPAGVFYYHIQDPLVDKQERNTERALLKALRPDGLVCADDRTLAHLDRDHDQESIAIPVRYRKDGTIYQTNKAVDESDFDLMVDHGTNKIREGHDAILAGETSVYPYRLKKETGCDYCPYRTICGFDERVSGYRYHEMADMSRDEVLTAMRAERKNREDGD